MDEIKGICREEIALEGLDGITFGSLWFRLQNCMPAFPLPIDDYTKPFIWELISSLEDVNFFELPTARPPITVADDAKEFSELLATYVWFDQVAVEPQQVVNDEESALRGCSTTYYTRKNITSEVRPETGKILTFAEVESR
ncbi:general transcription factor 3C polypeptide 1-like [Anneissia japonica]|uniref:general transcription factor 3C polypeptide 1-like n=1 Tax=Anneissia japonica TaxID=1529436 RepID=UPI001425B826|nr:general transcription factor 3C polypeptide 1-like [Anneissia japonica]